MKAVIFIHILNFIFILNETMMVRGIEKCESKIELRAVLLSCPAKDSGCDDDDPLTLTMRAEEVQLLQGGTKNFESLKEEKERGFPNAIKDCKRKIIVTIKVKNSGKIPCEDEYIIVDHVFDPLTGGRGRLLSPLVLKLRQEQMVQLYGLQFQRVVNGEPFEEQKEAGKICSVNPNGPTCGIATYDGKPIPFSEGFCCSCDANVNAKRQLSSKSYEDSFLYRDSALISQENDPKILQEKFLGTILNPELINLKSWDNLKESANVEEDASRWKDSGKNDKSPVKELTSEKLPNFLMERDRKIVCDKGDFLSELCKLQDEKHEEVMQSSSSTTDSVNKISSATTKQMRNQYEIKKRGFVTALNAGRDTSLKKNRLNNAAIVQGLIGTLALSQTGKDSPQTQDEANNLQRQKSSFAVRGKRENSKDLTSGSKDRLSLEEKLKKFADSRKILKSRRKRLLELPHDRGRKTEATCNNEKEYQSVLMSDYASDSGRYPLPKYFFAHDKSLIDPVDPSRSPCNSTFRKEFDLEIFKASEQIKPDNQFNNPIGRKGENYAVIVPQKKWNMIDNKNEGNTKKDMASRMKKLEEVSHNSGENIDKISNTDKYKMGSSVHLSKNRNKLKSFSANVEGVPQTGTSRNVAGETLRQGPNDEKINLNIKNTKVEETKSDRERFQPKANHYLTEKNRENSNMNSDIVKEYKKPSENKEEFQKEEKEPLERVYNEGKKEYQKNTEFQKGLGSNVMKKERDKLEKENSENTRYHYQPDTLSSNERGNRNRPMYKTSKNTGREYWSHPRKEDGNVDFKMEILRQNFPESLNSWPPSSQNEPSFGRQVSDTKPNVLSKPYNRRPVFLRNRQNLIQGYKPIPQQCYISENGRTGYPRGVYLFQNGADISPEVEKEYINPSKMAKPSYREHPHRHYHFIKPQRHREIGNNFYIPTPEQGSYKEEVRPYDIFRNQKNAKGVSWSKRHDRNDRKYEISDFVNEFLLNLKKTRKKRAVGYPFKMVKGFFETRLPLRQAPKPEKTENTIRGLEYCLSDGNTGKADNITGWQFFRFERDQKDDPSVTGRDQKVADKERLKRSLLNAPSYVLQEMKRNLKEKGRSNTKDFGERRSRHCDSSAWEDTAHCMRFADLWYSVYLIKKPVVAQTVGIQLFEKHSRCDARTQWRDITKGRMVRIGTYLPQAEDDLPTISMSFLGQKSKKLESAIDPDNYLVMIPSHMSDPSKARFYPQFEGGPEEYLVVAAKDVSLGGECDMIGTSFEAFARQPDRCSRPLGSCLRRQPVDLWREDMAARIRGKRGQYFVENFGTVPNSPVKTYTNYTGEYLALEYYGQYSSTIEIEVKADYNAIIRKGSSAQIPSVYIDGTYPKRTRIVLSVLNIGFTSSNFRPRLGDCPPDLDPNWCPLEGSLVTIPPQQRHDFKLDLSGTLPPNKIHVTVQVLNQMNKKVAFRKILIKKGERCVCAFHCKCNCIGNLADDRSCRKLSLEDYRGAGYMGPFPYRGSINEPVSDSVLGNIHIVFLTASYVLLLCGTIKGILGIFVRRIGIAGTRIITGPKRICRYYECELAGCTVLYDESGFPVHPTTGFSVQIVPLWLEILINSVIFFLYPLRGLCFFILSFPCCKTMCSECDGCCRNDEEDYDSDLNCSHPLLSKNVQASCVNYNLTTFNTRKGKTDDFLPYLPYKGDDDPLEEDDTEFVLQEMKRYRKK